MRWLRSWLPCWPFRFGSDEMGRRTLRWTFRWTAFEVPISRRGTVYPPEGYGCCALPEGHDGVCAWKCSGCVSGRCPMCQGSGGPDDAALCEWCEGSGACPDGCFEGWVTEDVMP